MKHHRLVPSILVATALLCAGGSARAQVGSGWTEVFPEKTIQLRGDGARYTNENGIETFSMEPGDERAEARIHNDHRSGTWQFEGWVNVGQGVNGGSVHQVFLFLMIVAYPNDGGELRQHSYQNLDTTGIYDRWVRINTIHDADERRAEIYIDGALKGTMDETRSGGADGWYHKYGIYNSSNTRPVVQWRDVKFFRDGNSEPASAGGVGGSTGGNGTSGESGVGVSTGGAGEAPAAGSGGGGMGGNSSAGTNGGAVGTGGASFGGTAGTTSGADVPGDGVLADSEGGCTCRTGAGSSGHRGASLPAMLASLLAIAWLGRRRNSGDR